MSLAGVAKENNTIVERGGYALKSGAHVDLRAALDAAIAGSVLHRPGEYDALTWPAAGDAPPRVEVTGESTGAAARRLVVDERLPRVVLLNFASGKHPGGGYLRGAKSQEEDLCRCSALYNCQLAHRGYYDANRVEPSLVYTDHMIYSPDVPFFRDERYDLLPAPFLVSAITAPAPNAGEALRRDPDAGPLVHRALVARAGHVLAVAAHHGHRNLVLGAWGCGVFRNDPRAVADVFADWLAAPRFRGAFDRVVFAVYSRGGGGPNYEAFAARFAAPKTLA